MGTTYPFSIKEDRVENITVLVVDNDRADNRTLQDGLSDIGFNVLTTNTELDGLEELQYGANIDVVLLDYNAPRLDGSPWHN